MGISVDSIPSHVAWQKKEIGWIDFPLGSDFWPHGEIAAKFGVLRREGPPLPGISDRSVFIIDKEGKIAFAKVYAIDKLPDHEELFAVLRGLERT